MDIKQFGYFVYMIDIQQLHCNCKYKQCVIIKPDGFYFSQLQSSYIKFGLKLLQYSRIMLVGSRSGTLLLSVDAHRDICLYSGWHTFEYNITTNTS